MPSFDGKGVVRSVGVLIAPYLRTAGPVVAWHARCVHGGKLPAALSLEDAFRAAFFMTEQYVNLEAKPDAGLVLFLQYLQSDPARWHDWKQSVQHVIEGRGGPDPLSEDLDFADG